MDRAIYALSACRETVGYEVLVKNLRAHDPWKSVLSQKHPFAVLGAVLQIIKTVSISDEKGNKAQGADSIYEHIGP